MGRGATVVTACCTGPWLVIAFDRDAKLGVDVEAEVTIEVTRRN